MKFSALLCLLLVMCCPVTSLAVEPATAAVQQTSGQQTPAPTTSSDPAVAATAPVRTLEVIDALRPDIDWTPDPFARRPNRFDGRFGGGPSAEEIALQHGGYLMYGINRALYKGGSWLNRATGGPAQIQAAHARDVPLDDEQIARAARWASPEAAQGA